MWGGMEEVVVGELGDIFGLGVGWGELKVFDEDGVLVGGWW